MHNTVTAITKCINVLNSHALDIFFCIVFKLLFVYAQFSI